MEDRRILRTQGALMEALVALIMEKGFEALTIQELVDRANIGRSTFYAHYEGKEDLLLSALEQLKSGLAGPRPGGRPTPDGSGGRVLDFTTDLFAHMYDHRQLFRAMAGRKSGALVRQGFESIMGDLVREDLARNPALRAPPQKVIDLACEMAVGAFSAMVPKWLGSDPALPPQEMEQLFRRFVLPGLADVLEWPRTLWQV